MQKKMKNKRGINWKVLVSCLVIVYAIAFIGGVFTSGNTDSAWYETTKTSLTPPNFIFPIVWNVLFFLIALSLYFAWTSQKAKKGSTKKSIAILFGINLFFNALWSLIFFGLKNTQGAFFELVALWLSIIALLVLTYRVEKKSFYLLIPYFLWVTFAGILNFLIAF